LEFFAANIRDPRTRRAYHRAVAEFMAWCEDVEVISIAAGIVTTLGNQILRRPGSPRI
jgi:hypothetical protein